MWFYEDWHRIDFRFRADKELEAQSVKWFGIILRQRGDDVADLPLSVYFSDAESWQ